MRYIHKNSQEKNCAGCFKQRRHELLYFFFFIFFLSWLTIGHYKWPFELGGMVFPGLITSESYEYSVLSDDIATRTSSLGILFKAIISADVRVSDICVRSRWVHISIYLSIELVWDSSRDLTFTLKQIRDDKANG